MILSGINAAKYRLEWMWYVVVGFYCVNQSEVFWCVGGWLDYDGYGHHNSTDDGIIMLCSTVP
jgi:hypothetical protein